MASLAYVEREINSLPTELRPALLRIFQTVLKDLRIGHPTGDVPDPTENMGGGFFHATTAATANDEFTVAHGFGRVPYLVIPVLPLDVVNAEIVPLTVTRAADDKRIYLSSSVESAPVSLWVEG